MIYPALITLLTSILLMVLAFLVGLARGKYKILPPAMSGHIEFEKRFRIHQNATEQAVIFLPAMWVFAYMLEKPELAAAIGAVWLVGRILYAVQYISDPSSRMPGFFISLFSTVILILGAFWGIGVRLFIY